MITVISQEYQRITTGFMAYPLVVGVNAMYFPGFRDNPLVVVIRSDLGGCQERDGGTCWSASNLKSRPTQESRPNSESQANPTQTGILDQSAKSLSTSYPCPDSTANSQNPYRHPGHTASVWRSFQPPDRRHIGRLPGIVGQSRQ